MFTRQIIAVLCLGSFVVSSRAGRAAKCKPIDPATIAAYEKLGAEYGGFEVTDFAHVDFLPGEEAAAKGLPGFNINKKRDANLPKLPPVRVSFGLCFGDTWATRAAQGSEGLGAEEP